MESLISKATISVLKIWIIYNRFGWWLNRMAMAGIWFSLEQMGKRKIYNGQKNYCFRYIWYCQWIISQIITCAWWVDVISTELGISYASFMSCDTDTEQRNIYTLPNNLNTSHLTNTVVAFYLSAAIWHTYGRCKIVISYISLVYISLQLDHAVCGLCVICHTSPAI